jgi:hypothetical protein
MICPHQQRWWAHQPERLGGLEVDDEPEIVRLLDGQAARLAALQDSIDIPRRSATEVSRKRRRSITR